MSLVVQSADGQVVAQSNDAAVKDGQVVELTVTAEVPKATSLTVFAPLYFSGERKTDIVDMRVYKIVGVKGESR